MRDLMQDLLNTMLNDDLENMIEKATEEECEIHVIKDKCGMAHVNCKGTSLGVLITLASFKKAILEKTNTTESMFKIIENNIDTKESKQ